MYEAAGEASNSERPGVMGKYTVHRIFRNIYLQYEKNIVIKQTKNIMSTNVQQPKSQKSLFLSTSEAQSLDSDKKLSK